jgi:excisionase family DNA binding protein
LAQERQKTGVTAIRAKPEEPDSPDHVKDKKVEYLTARQLAEILQVSESTVHRLRRSGRIPAILLTDRLIRFNLKDVQKALKSALASRDGEQDQDSATSQLSFEDFFSDFNI